MGVYSKLARAAVEHYVKSGGYIAVPLGPLELGRQRACYVSVIESPGRRVRGMHGSVLPARSTLAEEIIANAIAAIEADSKRSVTRPDLVNFKYSVALLDPLQRISDKTHLDPMRFGLYIRSDRDKTALLLPQRAGVDTAEDQIATAVRESGIELQSETFSLYRFAVTYDDD